MKLLLVWRSSLKFLSQWRPLERLVFILGIPYLFFAIVSAFIRVPLSFWYVLSAVVATTVAIAIQHLIKYHYKKSWNLGLWLFLLTMASLPERLAPATIDSMLVLIHWGTIAFLVGLCCFGGIYLFAFKCKEHTEEEPFGLYCFKLMGF